METVLRFANSFAKKLVVLSKKADSILNWQDEQQFFDLPGLRARFKAASVGDFN